MDEPIIIAKNLSKHFKSRKLIKAVDNVTLEVIPGEVFGVIGPDGAGKTTLTRLILGLLSRTSGESTILGFDPIKDPYKVREKVGYVAQQYTLPPDLTVEENMVFFADAFGVQKNEQKARIAELLDFTGLASFTDRITRKLSGGMKKKLALSCSLINNPSVLLLDEPTLGVDPVSRREFWSMLSTLRAERGTTIFVNTPYMDEAERCNRVGLIFRGEMIAIDTPRNIKSKLPGSLLEFHPDPDRFDDVLIHIQNMPGIYEVQTYGSLLHVFVDDLDKRETEIKEYLLGQNINWDGMRKIEPRMEEAFINLIHEQQRMNDKSSDKRI